MIVVELAYPAKELSPNARVHHMALHRFKKAAKADAEWATKIAKPRDWKHDGGRLSVSIAFHPVKGKAAPDKDNAQASLKAALDGVAAGLGVDDKLFDPTLDLAEPLPRGRVIITIGNSIHPVRVEG